MPWPAVWIKSQLKTDGENEINKVHVTASLTKQDLLTAIRGIWNQFDKTILL